MRTRYLIIAASLALLSIAQPASASGPRDLQVRSLWGTTYSLDMCNYENPPTSSPQAGVDQTVYCSHSSLNFAHWPYRAAINPGCPQSSGGVFSCDALNLPPIGYFYWVGGGSYNNGGSSYQWREGSISGRLAPSGVYCKTGSTEDERLWAHMDPNNSRAVLELPSNGESGIVAEVHGDYGTGKLGFARARLYYSDLAINLLRNDTAELVIRSLDDQGQWKDIKSIPVLPTISHCSLACGSLNWSCPAQSLEVRAPIPQNSAVQAIVRVTVGKASVRGRLTLNELELFVDECVPGANGCL